MERAARFDISRLDGVRVSGSGALVIPAYLTRTGVLTYRNPDGSERKELRHPSEVFKAQHLDSFRGLPVTVGHPGAVTPDNWRQTAVGHIGDDVKQDGKFIAASVHVQERSAIQAVQRKDLVELSAGYMCDIDETPGVYNGERFDAKQTNITANHVALGARDFGRAGNEVRLRMDGREFAGAVCYTNGMDVDSLKEANGKLSAEVERLKGELDAANARADAAVTRADAADKKLADVATPEAIDALVKDRLSLVQDAQTVVGRRERFDGKSDADVMRAAILKAHPKMRLDGKSDEYLRGLFEGVVKEARVRKASVVPGPRLDSKEIQGEDKIDAARKRNQERSQNAWKGN